MALLARRPFAACQCAVLAHPVSRVLELGDGAQGHPVERRMAMLAPSLVVVTLVLVTAETGLHGRGLEGKLGGTVRADVALGAITFFDPPHMGGVGDRDTRIGRLRRIREKAIWVARLALVVDLVAHSAVVVVGHVRLRQIRRLVDADVAITAR